MRDKNLFAHTKYLSGFMFITNNFKPTVCMKRIVFYVRRLYNYAWSHNSLFTNYVTGTLLFAEKDSGATNTVEPQ